MSSREAVRPFVKQAHSIAWDGCHKIYLLLDEKQTDLMIQYGYKHLITTEGRKRGEILDQIMEWYKESCPLKLVDAVRTTEGIGSDEFISVVPQR